MPVAIAAPRRGASMRTVGLGLALPAGAAATLVLTNGSTAANADQLAMALTAEGTASATSAPSDQSKAAAGAALCGGQPVDQRREQAVARSAERAADIPGGGEQRRAGGSRPALDDPDRPGRLPFVDDPGGAPGSHAWTKPVAGYPSPRVTACAGAHPPGPGLRPAGRVHGPAMSSGQVVSAEYDGPFGNKVVIKVLGRHGHVVLPPQLV